jgi:hypothetical protein
MLHLSSGQLFLFEKMKQLINAQVQCDETK